MTEKITQAFIQKYPPTNKRVTIRDSVMHFLLLRIEPSGKKTFLLDYYLPNGKRNTKKIGDATIITPNQAREHAEKIIAEIKLNGTNPYEKKKVNEGGKTCLLLGDLRDTYGKWVLANRKSGQSTMDAINRNFQWLIDKPVVEIKKFEMEMWRTDEKQKGKKSATINREVVALLAMLNWGVTHELINANPIAGIRKLKETDSSVKVRYLSVNERKRLLEAIDGRKDLMKPLIIVAMNTGIRKGSLFALKWRDVHFKESTITLEAESTKSGKMTIVPMNTVACNELKRWGLQRSSDFVFPSPKTGGKLDNVQTSWDGILKTADIANFRFHDLRHDFASQLVMKGVDLNTVRELLGHSDIKMTLRYAHLAPSKKSEAVELLEI